MKKAAFIEAEFVPTPIGDLTHPVRSWNPGIEAADERLTYVDLSSIGSEAKAIESPSEVLGREAPSRARQKIRSRDILVSTVRPNLNAVAWVTAEFDGATASTGFCVLRPNLEMVSDRYLYHWVRTPAFVGEMTKVATGASYPAVSDRIIKSSNIPLPATLAEQKRLASILDQADAIRRKRQQALRLTDDFLRSVFLDFFGDPSTNSKGWPSTSLGELVGDTFRNGLSPSNAGEVDGKVLTLTAITAGKFDSRYVKPCRFDRPPSNYQTLHKGTFLICRGNGNKRMVGIGLYSRDSDVSVAFPDTMIGCSPAPTKVTPEYLEAIWASELVRRQIEEGARTTNGTFKVNQQVLGSIKFPIPHIAIQQRYAQIAATTFHFKTKLGAQSAEAVTLFQSLQHRAFTGQL